MTLQQDIQQSGFKNEYQKGLINIIFTYNWLNERIKSVFEQQDITAQQFNILRILRGAGKPLSTLQIRQRMLDKMSDTSRIVDRLILKGYVSKETCPVDKRLVDVSITTKGKSLLKVLDGCEEEMQSHLKNLDEKDLQKLNDLLDKIRG